MFQFYRTISIFLISMFCAGAVFAAEIRPTNDIGALKTAFDSAKDGDVVILERGKVYYSQVSMDINVNLTIKADENTVGRNPIIAPLVKLDGGLDKIMMFVRANLTCINIHFHAGISGALGGDNGKYGINFIGASNLRFIMQGCWMEDWDQRALQLEAPDMKIYFTDCIFIDDHKTTGPSEGRTIDLREFGPDTLLIKNCTFVNVADRWIRHLPNAGKMDPINYAVIDHCTFVNGLNYRPAFDFGHIEKLQFTNNIVYNPGILGSDFMRRPSKNSGAFFIADPADYYSTNSALVPHRLSEVYYDRSDGIVVLACHGVDSMKTEIVMRNNNLFMDQSIIDKIATNDTLHVSQWWCSQFRDAIVGDVNKAYITEALPFVSAPPPAVEIVDKYVNYWDQNSANMYMYYTAPDSMNLNYGTAAQSYAAGDGGFPLGDLNWYPQKKAQWKTWMTGVKDIAASAPVEFELSQNYPNPFNPVTTINYRLEQKAEVALAVYNMLGHRIRLLVNAAQMPGTHEATWNGLDDQGIPAPSGLYYYQMQAGSTVARKKMTLLK